MEKSTIRAGAADLFSFMAHIPVILLMLARFFLSFLSRRFRPPRDFCVRRENNNPRAVHDAGPLEKCSPVETQRELLRLLNAL